MFAHSLHDVNQGCQAIRLTFHISLLSSPIILVRSNAHFVSGDLFYLCRSRHRTSELCFQHLAFEHFRRDAFEHLSTMHAAANLKVCHSNAAWQLTVSELIFAVAQW